MKAQKTCGPRAVVAQVSMTTLLLLSAAVWGYYLYKPLPEGIANPWKVQCIVSLFKVVEDLAILGEKLGVASKIDTIRTVTNALSLLTVQDTTGLKVSDEVFDGVDVRVYDPVDRQVDGPAIVFYHGGGWFFCNVDVHHHVTSELARRLNMVVISVNYRLAPDHPYPAPLADCLRATRHFLRHARTWDVHPNRVAVMGDSAGGNLAAAVSLDLHLTSDPVQPRLQVLIYPALQGVDLSLPSFMDNDDVVYGSRRSMAEVLLYYMGETDLGLTRHLVNGNSHNDSVDVLDSKRLLPERFRTNKTGPSSATNFYDVSSRFNRFLSDPLFAPLMAESLAGLPQSYIITAQYDVLRDEGVLYAERLKAEGVHITWDHYDDAFHGFWAFFNPPIQLDAGQRSMDRLVTFLEENL